MRTSVLHNASVDLAFKAIWILQVEAGLTVCRKELEFFQHVDIFVDNQIYQAEIAIYIKPSLAHILQIRTGFTYAFQIVTKDNNDIKPPASTQNKVYYGRNIIYVPKISEASDVISEKLYPINKLYLGIDFHTFTPDNKLMLDLIKHDKKHFPVILGKKEPIIRMIIENFKISTPSHLVLFCTHQIGGVDLDYVQYIC